MRYSDLIVENTTVQDATLDLLTVMAGEGVSSIPLDTISQELQNQDIDVDSTALFDVLNNLAIVKNIKENVVFFNTDSDASRGDAEPDPEKQDKTIDKLARKQTKKAMDK